MPSKHPWKDRPNKSWNSMWRNTLENCVMYGCESWTINKAEHRTIDAFELWCWRRLLRVPWTARRSNQSILKKISPEYSLEGLMLKLKLQYFGYLMWRTDSLKKTLMLVSQGIWRQEEKGTIEGEMVGWHHWLNGHELEQAPGVVDGQGGLACCSRGGRKESDATEWLNWTKPLSENIWTLPASTSPQIVYRVLFQWHMEVELNWF